MSFDLQQLNAVLLAGSAIVLVAIVAVLFSTRAGLPSLLAYLALGVLLGESGLGIAFEDAEMAQALAIGALVVILTEGGFTTSWRDIRPVIRTGALLATVGIMVGVGVMTLLAHYVLGFDWQLAILLGAITAPTDAAAVFAVLRRVPLPRRLTGTLESESGLNDAPTVVLVTLASQADAFEQGILAPAGFIVFQLGVGVLVGVAAGWGGGWILRRAALPASGLYPLAILAFSVLGYAVAAQVGASGIAAVYTAALILGNSELPHRAASRSFTEGMGWLAQIGLFVMLGVLVSPGRITLGTVGLAFAAILLLSFVARPLAVVASAVWQRNSAADLVFMSWAGLKGSIPIVLATIPLAAGVEDANLLFDMVFVLVILDTLVTGPTLPWLARRLGYDQGRPIDLEIEAAPLERIAADLLQIKITSVSKMRGVEVGELRLPKGASVTLVVRDGQTLVPSSRTILRDADELLVVTPRKVKEQTERRLRLVSQRGRLAHWLE